MNTGTINESPIGTSGGKASKREIHRNYFVLVSTATNQPPLDNRPELLHTQQSIYIEFDNICCYGIHLYKQVTLKNH